MPATQHSRTTAAEPWSSLRGWLLPSVFLAVLGTGCLGGSAVRHAKALEEGTATFEQLHAAQRDADPHLRCLAARACVKRLDPACLDAVVQAALGDPSEQVQQCALQALSASCNTVGRGALARLVKQAPEDPDIRRAFGHCPSADTLWVLLTTYRSLRIKTYDPAPTTWAAPSDAEQLQWLEALMKLPGPREQVSRSLSGLREAQRRQAEAEAARRAEQAAQQQRLEEARRAEAEERAAEQERLAQEQRAVEQEQEQQRRLDERWGPFSTWAARPQNAAAVATLRRLFIQRATLHKLRAEHEEERDSNDRAARPAAYLPVPLYPETSGAFVFVKILDRSAGEALFQASDGLFVLRLSPGDSFNAYPGQSVRMSMHARGERMSMTSGQRLPVFWSGSSPTRTRVIPAHKPNRGKETQLRRKVGVVEKALASERARSLRPEGEGRLRLKVVPGGTRIVAEEWDGELRRVLVSDAEDGSALYCLAEPEVDCSEAHETVDLEEFLGRGREN
jgi:hypothetical protein